MADPVAQVPAVAQLPTPLTFRELFATMPDVYNGMYNAYLQAFAPNDEPATQIFDMMLRFPHDQVPSVLVYMGHDKLIRTMHHVHSVDRPFGQPPGPWANTFIGFVGDVTHNLVNTIAVPRNELFALAPAVVVPTLATMAAALVDAPAEGILPLVVGEDGVEEVQSRRTVPVPHAYVPLLFNRTLTPREAWEQVGMQIINDGRQEDCMILLNFLRLTNVQGIPGMHLRIPQIVPPHIRHLEQFHPPIADEELHNHIYRKLRTFLPGLVNTDPHVGQAGQQFLQGAALIRQSILDGNEVRRLDRQQALVDAGAPVSFSSQFPATAPLIRKLCGAGNDDNNLPEFWRILAAAGGKKKAAFPALVSLVMQRSNADDSAGIHSVISAYLFEQIIQFQLGSNDLDDITKGINPFLMCPIGHTTTKGQQDLNLQYSMMSSDGAYATITDIRTLAPSNFNLPGSVYQTVEFIGSLSVLIDVLLGTYHPFAVSLRRHFLFWRRQAPMVQNSVYDTTVLNAVMVGTLRSIQLATIKYINEQMYANMPLAPPTFASIEDIIHSRAYHTLPMLPAYYFPTPQAPANTSAPMQPSRSPAGATQSASTPAPTRTSGVPVVAKPDEVSSTWQEAFKASSKSIQDLRGLPAAKIPKAADGGYNICLSFHLRGSCFDNCRNKQSHRKLNAAERDTMNKLVTSDL
jgi:hypothetical protein